MTELTPFQQVMITLGGVGFIASTFGSVIVMWKVFKGIERFLDIPTQLERIVYELKPNGGASLRDGFDEIRAEARVTRSSIDRLTAVVNGLARTVQHTETNNAKRHQEFIEKIRA